jgi:hypothetical protein
MPESSRHKQAPWKTPPWRRHKCLLYFKLANKRMKIYNRNLKKKLFRVLRNFWISQGFYSLNFKRQEHFGEEDISTEQHSAQTNTWVYGAHVDQGRTSRFKAEEGQRP